MLPLVIGYFVIFLARVADVSLATLRMLFLVKGKKFLAAGIGFFEVIIYIIVLKHVVDSLNDPLSLVAYALGFACGNIVGGIIDEKVAVGQIMAQVITMHEPLALATCLRAAGYGVTITEGEGRGGSRPILNLVLPRKQLKNMEQMVKDWDPAAFVVVQEARSIYGGFFSFRRQGK
ncbi:MAG: DUF2179 domain-containing protein [Clostridia bacterium]|nr:DUF2179 domain-containing protein [Clostridia bacterium]